MSPADRFLVLSQLVDDVPADRGGELVRVVSLASFAVVRHMQGRATEAEARFALERARAALTEATATSGAA